MMMRSSPDVLDGNRTLSVRTHPQCVAGLIKYADSEGRFPSVPPSTSQTFTLPKLVKAKPRKRGPATRVLPSGS